MFPRLLLLLLVLLPLSAWAARLQGIRHYERGEYAKASRTLKRELNSPQFSGEQRALAHVYLAASLLALKKEDEAYIQLEELARTYPEQRVDPALFPPRLVELELKVRERLKTERLREEAEKAEQAELNRIAAAEDAERRRREQGEAARNPVQVQVEPGGELQGTAPARSVSSFRLRPEAIGFSDVGGLIAGGRSSLGFGLGVTVGSGMFDGSARALFGDKSLGVELDVGLVFGTGAFQPRVGVRGTLVPALAGSNAIGGGLAVGGRLALSPVLTALLDVSGQAFAVPEGYRSFVLMGSAGVGFNLL